jgi:hypothetical protein
VSLTLSPTSVIGGQPSVATLTISSPAPVGGLAIALSSDSKPEISAFDWEQNQFGG